MLARLVYASRASHDVTAETLAAILRTSKANNLSQGITGLLCYCATGGIFLQAIEGGRGAVSRLYNRISQDARHSEVTLLTYDEIAERSFGGWSMGQVHMSRLNPSLLLKYSETATLDPYAVPGRASQALLEELLATASIAGNA